MLLFVYLASTSLFSFCVLLFNLLRNQRTSAMAPVTIIPIPREVGSAVISLLNFSQVSDLMILYSVLKNLQLNGWYLHACLDRPLHQMLFCKARKQMSGILQASYVLLYILVLNISA